MLFQKKYQRSLIFLFRRAQYSFMYIGFFKHFSMAEASRFVARYVNKLFNFIHSISVFCLRLRATPGRENRMAIKIMWVKVWRIRPLIFSLYIFHPQKNYCIIKKTNFLNNNYLICFLSTIVNLLYWLAFYHPSTVVHEATNFHREVRVVWI